MDSISEIKHLHSIIRHPWGQTHFRIAGIDDAGIVILVPGITLPLAVWMPLAAQLTHFGFQVISYDLAGRGYSSRMGRLSGLTALVEQLDHLIEALNIQRPVHLVGLSAGTLIAAAYCIENPHKVSSVALIAPEVFKTSTSILERLVILPFLARMLPQSLFKRMLIRRAVSYSDKQTVIAHARRLLQFAACGTHYKQTVLADAWELPISSCEAYFRDLAKSGARVRVILGRDDQLTPAQAAIVFREIFGQQAIDVLDDVGHLPNIEKPTLVASILAEHFCSLH